jgi:hypothetical protein
MEKNYNEYLENIKKKLDMLNKASGFIPNEKIPNNNMPSNDIFDMLGNGAKYWMNNQNLKK